MVAIQHTAPVPSSTTSERLVELLVRLGVRQAYGLIGGAIAPLCDALGRSELECLQLRHEAGAVFAAVEASLATRRPVAVFVTTGPGLMNALNGAIAARSDGAHVVVLSGATSAAQRGRFAVQETSMQTLPASGITTAGPIFDYAVTLESPSELAVVARRLAQGFARPQGFVAHVSLPIATQQAPAPALPRLDARADGALCSAALLDECAARMGEGSLAILVGHGARGAADEVRALAARTGARVLCTPRGRGIFPESDAQFVGVTGVGGHDAAERSLRADPPEHLLVLGSRLGEYSTGWQQWLVPTESMLHVDLDDAVFGAAFPDAPTIGVRADVGAFVRALLPRLAPRAATPIPRAVPPLLAPREVGPVRPRALMAALQREVVDGSDAVIIAESGNAMLWTTHELSFEEAGRYRVSGLWGSMGHATSGVVGLALARRGKAVAVVGDGAMLMMNEVSSAVQYDAPAVWIVLNDANMAIVDRGMSMLGLRPFQTQLPATDFAAIAQAQGAVGIVVRHEHEIAAALAEAMTTSRPCVVDVRIDPTEHPPMAKRISALSAMGAQKQG